MKNAKYSVCFHSFFKIEDKNTNSEKVAIAFYEKHKKYNPEIYINGEKAILTQNYNQKIIEKQ